MNDRPGVEAHYYDDTVFHSSFNFISSRSSHDWIWASRPFAYGPPMEPVPTMQLSSNHVLTIYDANGNPGIVLDPANQGGLTSVLTVQAADERYDSRYLSRTAITVGNGSSIAFTGGSATGAYSFAGLSATASGYNSIALGNCSSANGVRSIALGDHSIAHGENSVALGASAIANGNFSLTIGCSSTASGISSTAFGACSAALGDYSIAAGPYTISSGFAQFVIGQNNVPQGNPSYWDPSDNLFIVGNGAPYSVNVWVDGYSVPNYVDYYDENGNYIGSDVTYTWVDGYYQTEWATGTSNAFVVKKNGDTTVYGSLTVSATNGSTAATSAGFSTAYSDGSNGVGASITQSATRPTAVWNWQRLAASGSAVPVMQIDASNRLVLTGTDAVNPPQLVLDPNGQAGSSGVLTQASADSRYVVNGGSAGTVLANTAITGTAAVTGGLAVTGTATLNGDPLLTQTAANTQYVLASSGTASNLALSGSTSVSGAVNVTGTTKVTGRLVITGTLDTRTNTVVATDSSRLMLIPQQGDLSMGNFTVGEKPQ